MFLLYRNLKTLLFNWNFLQKKNGTCNNRKLIWNTSLSLSLSLSLSSSSSSLSFNLEINVELMNWLVVVFFPQEFFTHVKTSLLPVKSCFFFGAYGDSIEQKWIYFDIFYHREYRFKMSYPKDCLYSRLLRQTRDTEVLPHARRTL